MEAVEVLARQAGMAMPARDPQAQQVADRRSQLIGVVEEAVKWFRLQLRTANAEPARAYLKDKRRLSEDAQDRWGIGWAPDNRSALYNALKQKGIADELIVDSGLCAKPDDGGAPYDRFRGRIIFPIRDGRGRAISLGGRSLDPNARAKYLNGPETEIFDKGRNLFNLSPAREAAGKGKPLIVAEGYMDVIALVEAGFTASVAPLGTAVTADQLALMWRIHNEPIIALDGDTAGIRAGLRVVDLALPLLQAGKGLRFAALPAGLDPDDLIKSQGPAAMQGALDAALPMVKLLWNREKGDEIYDSPERKAALRKRLRVAVSKITDHDIKQYYAEAFKQYEFLELTPINWAPTFFKSKAKSEGRATANAKASVLARYPTLRAIEYYREIAILAVLMSFSEHIGVFEGDLAQMEMLEDDHAAFLETILHNQFEQTARLRELVANNVGLATLDRVMNSAHVRVIPCIKNNDPDDALSMLQEQLAKLSSDRAWRKEVEEGMHDIDGVANEGLTWRVTRAGDLRRQSEIIARTDHMNLGEDRVSLSNHLDEILKSIDKPKKSR
jgi:DNA primase